ncbi:MAG: hypothetical protein H6Q05_4794 [Acidobacteria bacterium]|nr:hypothetical protein [Acidobacteriota bacterium]
MTDAVSQTRTSFVAWLARRLNLRFPALFAILAIVTVADVLIPDFIPFADEIGLALLTALIGSWKKRAAKPDATVPPQA